MTSRSANGMAMSVVVITYCRNGATNVSAPTTEQQQRATAELDQLCINTIRTLSLDAVQQAKSGHPGLPLGAAPMAYVLWTRFYATTR